MESLPDRTGQSSRMMLPVKALLTFQGDVVGIVGTVGSGKSALMLSLLGQVRM